MTTRSKDNIIEREVAKFMDQYLWQKLAKSKQTKASRVSSFDLQVKGVDVKLGNMCIDEKCKFHGLLNKILQYPSFEVSFRNRAGDIQDGWFVKEDSITTHYAFIAVFADTDDEYNISFDNIQKLNVLLLKKEEVIGMVEDDIKADAESLRDIMLEERQSYDHRKYWLKMSSKLYEQPINLVTTRKQLLSLPSTREIEVTRTSVKRI